MDKAVLVILFLSSFLSSTHCVDEGDEGLRCRKKVIQKELYRSLYRVLGDNAICSSEKTISNVELLDLGTPLSFADFNPGKPSPLAAAFSQPGALPLLVVENGLPLVDEVYPTGTYRFRLMTNASARAKDYQFDSFSSMYDYVLTHMMLLPRNFSDEDVLRAKYYLQELVPNPERVLRNETELPRFLLYDYYRYNYLNAKGDKDDAIDTNRTLMTQLRFELWGQKKLSRFESDTEAAYVKWQAFGYKSEVEKQLQFFDIDTHEEKLMSSRALFKSMGRPSEKESHTTIYPFTLEPENWYKQLKVNLPESADELRYKKSLLLAKQALLNATKTELNNKTSSDIERTQNDINQSLADIQRLINNGVDKLLQMELECFTRINLTMCAEIIDGHTAFRSLLEELAEHIMQSEYLKSILDRKTQVLEIIQEKLSEVNSDVRVLDVQISKRERGEASEAIDASTSSSSDATSCPGVGQIKFTFDSQHVNSEEYCQEHADTDANQMDCIDVEVPANATSRDLWNVNSCTVDSELKSFEVFESFVELMNSVPVKITASLLKVDVHRPWFDPSLFEDSTHYTMKRDRGVVSPGPLTPSIHFQRMAHSGNYLLPHYVSAFIVASNVQLFFPGLGAWNSSNSDQTNEAVSILMKYAYAPVLTGGVGPFSFSIPAADEHNYQLRRKNGGLLITLPGGQVIGYIMKSMPRFPNNQSEPQLNGMECDEDLTNTPLPKMRAKRSATGDPLQTGVSSIKELAKSLFSEAVGPVVPADHLTLMRDKDVVSTQYIEKLIRDGDMKKEQLAQFIRSIEKGNSAAASNTTMEYSYE